MFPRHARSKASRRWLVGMALLSLSSLLVLASPAFAQEAPPVLGGVDPPEAACGGELELIVFGRNFTDSTQVEFGVDGIEIYYVEFLSPQELQVGLFIGEEAPAGSWPVTVRDPETGLEDVREQVFTIVCEGQDQPAPTEVVGPVEPGGDDSGQPGPDQTDRDQPDTDFREPESGGARRLRWPLLLFGGLGALLAGALVALVMSVALRPSTRRRHRRQWEKQAQDGEPQQPCQVQSRYCQREVEIALQRSRIAKLSLMASPLEGDFSNREHWVRGEAAGSLDSIVNAYKRGASEADLQPRVDTLGGVVAREIVAWLGRVETAQRVALSAHREGVETTITFTLYRCVQKGPQTVWEEEDKWEVSYQQERDELVGSVILQNPGQPGLDAPLAVDLARLLMRFVAQVE
jgi:hypothetical protein